MAGIGAAGAVEVDTVCPVLCAECRMLLTCVGGTPPTLRLPTDDEERAWLQMPAVQMAIRALARLHDDRGEVR